MLVCAHMVSAQIPPQISLQPGLRTAPDRGSAVLGPSGFDLDAEAEYWAKLVSDCHLTS